MRLTDPSGNDTLEELLNLLGIGKSLKQGKDLYDYAKEQTSDENLYMAYKSARSSHGDEPPSREDVQTALHQEWYVQDQPFLRYKSGLEEGVQKFFPVLFLPYPFHTDCPGPGNDKDYQEWLNDVWNAGNESEQVQGVSSYYGGSGSLGGPSCHGK